MSPSKRPTHTAARASLSLGSAGMSSSMTSAVVLHEGWVLKKRRKKMQGFARRYFVLYQSGILVYSFEPGQSIRDQVFLHGAAISTAPGRKDIHIDSNTATFHLKCLSTDDFNQWMTALRKFIGNGSESRRSNSIRVSSRQGTVRLNKSGFIVEEMGQTLAELEDAFHSLNLEKRKSGMSRTKAEKEKRDAVFGLFKRTQSGGDVDSDHHDTNPSERIRSALAQLKAQHSSLVKSLPSHVDIPGSPLPPLPFTREEEEAADDESRLDDSSPLIRLERTNRSSIATTIADSINEWFDASDGAQEFVLDQEDVEPSRIVTNSSRSSLGQADGNSSIDTDSEEEEAGTTEEPDPSHVVRRVQLPTPPVADEGSLFTVLKKNVGKDLSTIALPVTFNEPLTLLQRAAEEVEYYAVLDQAAQAADPVERFCFVAAFAVSQYSHTRHRSGRKGFNPMLAETFEDVRFKFISEKVRHNPLEMAYHAEGKGWRFYGTSSGKTKFWGKSLEIIPLGTNHLKIGNNHYSWKKPSSFMRNLMVGTKYLEHVGKMTIENSADNSRCVLDFKQNGYWGPSNAVSGAIHDSSGRVMAEMEGKWDEQFARTVDSSNLRVLWRATPWPKNTHEYYGFTSYGLTLNEITADLEGKLPPTDSRYRPDVRALEEGELDLADEEKVRIEELQRERRKLGADRQPRWFKQSGDEWVYAGGYWEARSKGWKTQKVQPLW